MPLAACKTWNNLLTSLSFDFSFVQWVWGPFYNRKLSWYSVRGYVWGLWNVSSTEKAIDLWQLQLCIDIAYYNFFKIWFFYLRERERMSRGRVRGRSRLPTEQEAQCRAWSQDPEIMTWTKSWCLTDWATQAPLTIIFLSQHSRRCKGLLAGQLRELSTFRLCDSLSEVRERVWWALGRPHYESESQSAIPGSSHW